MLPNRCLLLSLGTTVMPWRNWKQCMVMKIVSGGNRVHYGLYGNGEKSNKQSWYHLT